MINTIKEYDTNGKCIHYRNSVGYAEWYDYDTNGNMIHFRDSHGYELWCEYDTNGKLINTRNTSGATGHHHAAAEAKVRGECADTLRDMESASHGYRRSSEEWQRRAERAEADANEVREAFKRVSIEMDRAERRQRAMGEHGKRWEERARKAEAALADAYRTAVRAALVAEMVAGVEKGREQHDAENCDSCDCGRGCPTLATNSTIDWAIALIRSTATTETEK